MLLYPVSLLLVLFVSWIRLIISVVISEHLVKCVSCVCVFVLRQKEQEEAATTKTWNIAVGLLHRRQRKQRNSRMFNFGLQRFHG